MISVTTKTTVEIKTPLCVKALAPMIGVTVGYVYKMRMAGFTMRRKDGIYEATPEQALRFIKRTKFRIIRGKIVLG